MSLCAWETLRSWVPAGVFGMISALFLVVTMNDSTPALGQQSGPAPSLPAGACFLQVKKKERNVLHKEDHVAIYFYNSREFLYCHFLCWWACKERKHVSCKRNTGGEGWVWPCWVLRGD